MVTCGMGSVPAVGLWSDVINGILHKTHYPNKFRRIFIGLLEEGSVSSAGRMVRLPGARSCVTISISGVSISFSEREVEVMYGVLLGHTNQEIANVLRLSPRTVEYYVGTIRRKVGMRSKMALMRFLETLPVEAWLASFDAEADRCDQSIL